MLKSKEAHAGTGHRTISRRGEAVKIIFGQLRSACALGVISCFVLFLTASAPHRVHHLFENLPKPHGSDHHAHSSIQSGTTSAVDHETNAHEYSADPLHADAPHDDQNHDRTAQTVCLLQSAAQHSHFSTASLLEIAFLKVEFGEQPIPSSLPLLHFNPSPFSQRAPPTI
jgi:hypothetical protein